MKKLILLLMLISGEAMAEDYNCFARGSYFIACKSNDIVCAYTRPQEMSEWKLLNCSPTNPKAK